jgi:tetratricopeptide (TPR) repeat protein
MGQFEPAIEQFERYLLMERKVRSLRHAAAYGIAVCHFLNRNWKLAIRAGKVAHKIDSRLAESHCLIADAYLALAQYDDAVRWYQRAVKCKAPPADHTLFVDPSCYAKYPQQQLARFGL